MKIKVFLYFNTENCVVYWLDLSTKLLIIDSCENMYSKGYLSK